MHPTGLAIAELLLRAWLKWNSEAEGGEVGDPNPSAGETQGDKPQVSFIINDVIEKVKPKRQAEDTPEFEAS